MRRWIVIGLVAAGIALIVGSLWVFQRRLIYFPTGDPGPPPPGWQPVELVTDDGLALAAWHRPPSGSAPVVVVFPGNAGNRGDRLGLGSGLVDEGFGVLLVDYRGYGGNDGTPSEAGLALDAAAATDFVRTRYPESGLLLFGESLGAGVAIGEATERAPDGLVLRSPFTSLSDAASANYFGVPTGWLLRDEYPNLERIRRIGVPVSVIAGTRDSIVPLGQSFRVHEEAAVPFEWVPIEGAGHNDSVLTSGPGVIAAVARLARATRGS